MLLCVTAGISLTIMAMLLACHNLYPSLRPYTTPFFQLSYYQPSQGVYVQGWNDIYFVISSAIAFTAIRAIALDWVLQPLARKAGLKRKASVRFAEQGWLWLYYGFFWTFGMVRLCLFNMVLLLWYTDGCGLVYLVAILLLARLYCHLGSMA